MNKRIWLSSVALATTMGMAASLPAFAQSTNSRTVPPASEPQMVNNGDTTAWANSYASQHNGRVSRDAYLQEMGRRWDALDQNRQGLTPAEVSRMTGHVDSSAPAARTGADAQPGNMGPGNTKGN